MSVKAGIAMAKGLDRHRERMDTLASFGRTLARRSGSKCELCGASGVSLSVYEVLPALENPHIERCIFICQPCEKGIDDPNRQPDHWRCLNNTVWSDIPALQVISVRLLRLLSAGTDWAGALLEDLYLEPEIEDWVGQK